MGVILGRQAFAEAAGWADRRARPAPAASSMIGAAARADANKLIFLFPQSPSSDLLSFPLKAG